MKKIGFSLVAVFLLQWMGESHAQENVQSGVKKNFGRNAIYHVALTESEAQATGLDEFESSLRKFFKNKHAKKTSLVWPRRIWYVAANGVMAKVFYDQRLSNNTRSKLAYQGLLSFSFANFVLAPLVTFLHEQGLEFAYNRNDPSYGKMKQIFGKLKDHANASCVNFGGVKAKLELKQGSIPVIPIDRNQIAKSSVQVFLDGKEPNDLDENIFAFAEPIVCNMGNYLEPLNDLIETKKCGI